MSEWTPSEEEQDIIMAFALENVIEYNGAPQAKSTMGRIMSSQPSLRPFARYLNEYITSAIQSAQDLYEREGRESSLDYLGSLGNVGKERLERLREMEGPKEKRVQVWKDLPGAIDGDFRVRFAPNPNAPLTIGHSRGVVINSYYADRYNGEFILRFDDTGMGTKPPLPEAYELIPEDIEWLTGEPIPQENIYYASDRLEIYYEWARQLISLRGAYVDTLSREEAAEIKAAGELNPCRNHSVEENLAMFEDMVEGRYRPGEAAVRIMSDPNSNEWRDPALRDFVLFRLQEGDHPRAPQYKCWPVLAFQGAIDDYLLGITHIIRGADLEVESRKGKMLYKFFGWTYPHVELWGRVSLLNAQNDVITFSSSTYAEGIANGVFTGWDDPRLWTVQGMWNRGYKPEAIAQFWMDLGMTKKDISAPLVTLDNLNKQMSAEFKAESKFDELAKEIAGQYRKKGKSPEEAERIGKATAYKVGVAKYGKRGMADKAKAGMKKRKSAETKPTSYMVGSDVHELDRAARRLSSMADKNKTYPEWWKSRLSVTADEADGLADYLEYAEDSGSLESLQAEWSGKCHRCQQPSQSHTMSWFNRDLLCMKCSQAEKSHPRYEEAKRREQEEVRQGNLNYEGIGFEAEGGRASQDLISALNQEGLELIRVYKKGKNHDFIEVKQTATDKTISVAISHKGLQGQKNKAVIGQIKRGLAGRRRRGQGARKLDAENWGGDPEGPLAKALAHARAQPTPEPLVITELPEPSHVCLQCGSQSPQAFGVYENDEMVGEVWFCDSACADKYTTPRGMDYGAEEYHYVKCFECERPGYTDQMTAGPFGYLCARCSNPHIDWSKYDYRSKMGAETFEADQEDYFNLAFDSNCLICERPFGNMEYTELKGGEISQRATLMNERAYESLLDRYEKDAQEIAKQAAEAHIREFGMVTSEQEQDFLDNALYTLKSKKNPFGMKRTARHLAVYWISFIPIELDDGSFEYGYGLDALNAYMSRYLIEGKEMTGVASQTIGFLRALLVDPERILGRSYTIEEIGGKMPRGRYSLFDPQFIEQYEAEGAGVAPPPVQGDTEGGCAICDRPFTWSSVARGLAGNYSNESDGGALPFSSSKDIPEDDTVKRTSLLIAGSYLFNYNLDALNVYFEETKKPWEKVANLLRLSLVPNITYNRELAYFFKDLDYREEVSDYPSAFIREWQADSVLGVVKNADTLESARQTLSAFQAEDSLLSKNVEYLRDMVTYNYGSGENEDFEAHGSPDLDQLHKYAESLLNLKQYLEEQVCLSRH